MIRTIFLRIKFKKNNNNININISKNINMRIFFEVNSISILNFDP